MTRVWGIHNDKIPADRLVNEGFVSLGWDETGDLRLVGDDQEALKALLEKLYASDPPGAIPVRAGMLRRLAFEITVGDLVVAPSKQQSTYNIGKVSGDYEFDSGEPLHRHRRPVEWVLVDAPREAFSQSARHELGSALALFQVANHADEIEQAVVHGLPELPSDDPAEPQMRYGLLQRAVLEILDEESPLQRRDVLDRLAERVALSEHELAPVGTSGAPRFEAVVAWGSVDMKAAGWIEKATPGWSITDAGRVVLHETDSETDLSKVSGAAYRKARGDRRAAEGRFKTPGYALIDAAVKLVDEGQWTTYSDIAEVAGVNAPTVGEYVHRIGLENHHRVVPVGRAPYDVEWQRLLEEDGVALDERGIPDPNHKVTAEDLREQLDALGLLPKVPKRAWLVRGSSVHGKDLVPTWLAEGWVSLPATNLRHLDSGITRDQLKPIIDEDYAHASYAEKSNKLDELHAFLSRMRPEDLVATVSQGRLHVGRLTGAAMFTDVADADANLRRAVHWAGGSEGIDYSDVPGDLAARLKVQRDVIDLTQQLETLEGLLVAEQEDAPPPVIEEVVLKDATPELAERLHVSQAWLQECIDLLNDRPQLIFYGPPGTGKTYIAQDLAKHVAGENVRLVQFHPSYSYEDFFEGFRPTPQGGFALKPGPMRRVVDQAVANPTIPHVLIIDEINRGNLAKVFGELYFLLEYRNSNVELLYADDDFSLPPNVYVIGTMNTADRSIALVDAAMRRRFAFLPLHPSEQPTSGVLRSWLKATGRSMRVADLLDELNVRIADPDFKIGPSYFMRDAVHEGDGLGRTWRTSILPLLEEHHYGELSGPEVAARYGLPAIASRVDRIVEIVADEEPDDAPSEAD